MAGGRRVVDGGELRRPEVTGAFLGPRVALPVGGGNFG